MSVTKEQLDEYIRHYMEGNPDISDEEEWKPIIYRNIRHNTYEVSNFGNIRRIDNRKYMNKNVRGNGYKYVRLCLTQSGTSKIFAVHRLVAWHFCKGHSKTNNVVNHLDGNKLNNYYKNLEWCTQQKNAQHAFDIGLQKIKYGDNTNRHFISSETAEFICQKLIEYGGSIKPILDELKAQNIYCTFGIIESIKQKETWTDISNKYFDKDEFKNQKENEIKLICETIIKYNGNKEKILAELSPVIPYISSRYISDIIEKNLYSKISDNYFNKDQYTRKNAFSVKEVHEICQELVKSKGNIKQAFDKLIINIPSLTIEKLKDIKNKGSYYNISDLYFKRGELKMNLGPSVYVLDLIRTLYIFMTPINIYRALNHDKYPNISDSIVSMICAGKHESYNKSNVFNLNEYYNAKLNKNHISIPSSIIDELIKSYTVGNSDIDDSTYDRLLEEYVKEHGESSRPFSRDTQSTAVNDIVGTLVKAMGVETPMREGQETYVSWKNKKKIDDDRLIFVQPKFDGGSVALDLETLELFTRGDYDNGESENVTEVFKYHKIKEIAEWIKSEYHDAVSMKFECIMKRDVYYAHEFDKQYKRPRDAMSAILHRRDPELAKCLTLIPLRVLEKDRMCVELGDFDGEIAELNAGEYWNIQIFIDNLLNAGAQINGYDCDGVVVSVINRDTGNIENEVAIKILNMVEETKLLDVKYQIGTSGRVTPVCILEPVKFEKVTVDHCTLSNVDRLASLGLKYNDTVRIMYNIVPYFIDSRHDGTSPIPMIEKCPICGHPYDMRFIKTLTCLNPDCTSKKLGGIVRYCKFMKMMGVAENTINDLWDAGLVKDIRDLYTITIDNIKTVKGYKDKSAENIIKSIDKASTEVPVERWLGSLPITNISTMTWKKIIAASYTDVNKFVMMMKEYLTPEDMLADLRIPFGIGEKTMNKIAEGLRLHWEVIKDLINNNCIKFKMNIVNKNSNGIKVGLSGTRDPELIKYLTEKGYEVIDYNNSCNILVIPYEGFTSGKVKKAMEKGKTIITVEEAYKL